LLKRSYRYVLKAFGAEEKKMIGCKKKASRWLLLLFLIATSTVGATSAELTRAIQLYYAGSPDAAISAIKSLALAGDEEAQLTLGNILYSLSKANKDVEIEDFIKWYEMAAAQGSVDANSALGAIYHNKWLESRSNEDAALAISYYENAIEQGDAKAQGYLSKLRRRGGFSVGEKLLPVPEAAPEPTPKPAPEPAPEPTPKPAPEPAPKPSNQTAQTSSESSAGKADEKKSTAPVKQDADETYDQNSVRVNLTEIASQCSQYTASGFDYYGESIEGAFLVGKARIESIEPSASQSNTRLIRLIQEQSGTVISLTLHEVPEEVAAKLKEKSDFAITGIVTSAQMIGAYCEVSLSYQTAE
jgi:TPR repeat protein